MREYKFEPKKDKQNRRNDRRSNGKPLDTKSFEQENKERIVSQFLHLKGNAHEIRNFVDILEKELQLDKEMVSGVLRSCLFQMPTKSAHYAAAIALLNARNPELAAELLGIAVDLVNSGLHEAALRQVKISLRFLIELMKAGMVSHKAILDILHSFFCVAEEPGVEQQRVDAFIFLILSALPWAGAFLREKCPQDLKVMMDGISTLMDTRIGDFEANGIHSVHQALCIYHSTDSPYPREDPLHLLWKQVLDLKARNWEMPILLDLSQFFVNELANQLVQEIGPIRIPSSVTVFKFTYQPKFWVFDDSVNVDGQPPTTSLPPMYTAARFVLDDVITDTIRIFSHNHLECTKFLLDIGNNFEFSFLNSENIQIYESVIEAIFSEMFKFPKCMEKSVYYTTLVMDLCRESLDKIPSVLGRSIKLLFSRLNGPEQSMGMDVECIRRFSEFFSHHLSNFGFAWKWEDWMFLTKESESTNQLVFVRESLLKTVRLSYYDRIRNSIPEEMETSEILFPQQAPAHYFALQEPELVPSRLFELVKDLNSKLITKEDVDNVFAQLNLISSLVSSSPDLLAMLPNNLTIERGPHTIAHEAFFQCIMFQGSKSFSHLLNIVERYLPMLQTMNDSPEKKLLTCEVTAVFWSNNVQFLEIILGKLVNYRILDARAVIDWLISDSNLATRYDQFYIWSILTSTVSKIHLKQEQISQKLEKVKKDSDGDANMDVGNTEERKALQEAFEASKIEKKDILKFVGVLSSRIEQDGSMFLASPYWYWVSQFMLQTAREFSEDIKDLKYTLDAVVFTNNLHPEILNIWICIKAFLELHGEHH